ncbi:hypothetical protein [Cognatiyoonia sp. IB215182]|uniref:hypothetical protein n=1 Tax=Cognatiyoonia sp. IB215182 TaxID=3097353 RepID=UPI002A120A2D|nr:hypothetical protein [Cognatiyoonia sp. IB215182]MDX8353391.1 hypothetical protein [Cognatiyoonia sp. IB215182]
MTKVLIGAFAPITAMFVNAVGGRFEGYLFPVVTMAEIMRQKAVGETSSRI